MAWVDRGTGHGVANRGQGRDGRADVVLQSNHYAGHHAVINSAPSQPGVDAPPLPSPSRSRSMTRCEPLSVLMPLPVPREKSKAKAKTKTKAKAKIAPRKNTNDSAATAPLAQVKQKGNSIPVSPDSPAMSTRSKRKSLNFN
uniref:Uncharacterized protein n=1 Tax=Oryza rufipogon TaxID=4529 RepID=A0A0E0QIX9_ORYRU